MRLYLKRRRNNGSAIAEYDVDKKEFVVLKGTIVSPTISFSEKFRGAYTIQKQREGKVVDCVLNEDICFRSASTAANFVTGCSTNGLKVWKDANGIPLSQLLVDLKDRGDR